MEFVQLSKQEYQGFAKKHPYRNYLNSLYAFEVKKAYGYENYFVGVKENGVLLGAAGISLSPLMKYYRYAYAQRGFLMDYQNSEVLSFFTKELKRYLKKKRVVFLRMDPYVAYQQRDENGNVVEDGFHHQYVLDHLREHGYQHQGFTTGFGLDSQVRWMMVLDLKDKQEDQVWKELNQRTRWSIHKAQKLGVEVKTLRLEELDQFYDMVEYAASTRQFANLPLSHYKEQMKIYGNEHAKFVMAYLDCEKTRQRLKQTLEIQIKELDAIKLQFMKTPDAKKYKNKRQAQQEMIDANKKQMKEVEILKQTYGNHIPIATAYFILYEDEIVYVASGAYDEFRSFHGPYAIQWSMIKEAIRLGVGRYNFYGTSGNFEKDASDYGVYLFKKGFHASVEELIGDFILPIRPLLYRFYQIMKNKSFSASST